MQPKWQKVKLKNKSDIAPWLRGKEIWVKIGRPLSRQASSWDKGIPVDITGFETNLEPIAGKAGVLVQHDSILDMYAEFAEDVEIIPRSVWSQVR